MTHPGFTLRPATMADYEALCALFAEGDEPHVAALPGDFRPVSPARPADYIAESIAGDGSWIVLAEEAGGGPPLGFIHYRLVSVPERADLVPRTFVYIDTLAVAARARRRGVARALMEHVHAWAAERGIGELELTVFEFNEPARRLYESLGYATLSRRMRRRL